MNNARFATNMHILTLLASMPGEWQSSEWMATSININTVMVRKELSVLQAAGLVVTRKGKDGGSMLGKPAAAITLAEVYAAIKQSEVLGRKNLNPNPKCPVGKNINKKLDQLFLETDDIVTAFLADKTLAGFVAQFHR